MLPSMGGLVEGWVGDGSVLRHDVLANILSGAYSIQPCTQHEPQIAVNRHPWVIFACVSCNQRMLYRPTIRACLRFPKGAH